MMARTPAETDATDGSAGKPWSGLSSSPNAGGSQSLVRTHVVVSLVFRPAGERPTLVSERRRG